MRSIVLLLDRRNPDEADLAVSAARVQAGIDRAKLKFANLQEQDLPARQSELVRDAVAQNALALVIEPADPADRRLAEAVREARAKGIPVVLLNWPLEGQEAEQSSPGEPKAKAGTAPAGSAATAGTTKNAPLVLVTAPPFEPFAKQLVASAIRNTKNAHLKPEGGAIIIVNSISDPFAPERTAAIRAALTAAGIKPIEEVAFAKSFEHGAKLLAEKLKAYPNIAMAIAIDTQSSTACREASKNFDHERPFVMAGFASESHITDLTQSGQYAAAAEFAPLRIIRKGITTAVALAQGRTVPDRTEQPITFYDSPPDSVAPKSQEYRAAMKKHGAR